jgi:hypothetical protein
MRLKDTFVRFMTQRTRSGQAVIPLAFIMIALILFVGLAADAALTFARWSTLRRAVDSAAIATASHFREGSDYSGLVAIATQYIRLHGIDPTYVKVETCETELDDFKKTYPSSGDALGTIVNWANYSSPPYDWTVNGPPYHHYPSELCKLDPQKIIRVTAQINSPLAFGFLVGWRNIPLSSTSLSQTAVLDVALLLNSSGTESEDTNADMGVKTATSTYNAAYPCGPHGTADSNDTRFCTGNTTAGTMGNYIRLLYPLHNPVPTDKPTLNNFYQYGDGRGFPPITDPSGQEQDNYGFDVSNGAALLNFKDFTGCPNPYSACQGFGASTPPYGLLLKPYATANASGFIDPNTGINFQWGTQGGATTANPNPSVDRMAIRTECFVTFRAYSGRAANYSWAGCCNDPTVQTNPGDSAYGSYVSTGVNGAWANNPDLYVCDDPNGITTQNPTGQSIIAVGETVTSGSTTNQICGDSSSSPGVRVIGSQTQGDVANQATTPPGPWSHSTAAYGSNFRSTNPDANANLYEGGDGNYSDLICQPFKQVRDAARKFLRKLDFVRGDRVAIINFDKSAHLQTAPGATVPIITDKTTAIRVLDYLVGVYIDPSQSSVACASSSGVNSTNRNYWTMAQCPDNNTGDAILQATAALTNPAYIRRESVWTIVMLSDGYPNRTSDRNNLFSDVSNLQHNYSMPSLDVHVPGAAAVPLPNTTQALSIDSCNPTDPLCVCNSSYTGTYAATGLTGYRANLGYVICSTGASTSSWTPQTPLGPWIQPGSEQASDVSIRPSYGFCPWWTFCDSTAGNPGCQAAAGGYPSYGLSYGTTNIDTVLKSQEFPHGVWENPPNTPAPRTGIGVPYPPICVSKDPNARHFCSNADGTIAPPNDGSAACDPHYDAMDYARDMADEAGLLQYTNTKPGNFIAMFTIFFAHHPAGVTAYSPGDKFLGIQFLRYMADVGDNGQVDDNLQNWYRYWHYQNPTQFAQQFPNYANLTYDSRFIGKTVSASEPYDPSLTGQVDACGQFDPNQQAPSEVHVWDPTHGQALGNLPLDSAGNTMQPGAGSAYDKLMETSCGQFFFAQDINAVNSAFSDIASRLFTRLSR